MTKHKSWSIPKKQVLNAYSKVRENKGGAGVDNVSLQDFEKDLKDNLYKLWNRMSSGSYFPKSVKEVEIPKKDGSVRKLGIPTVSDRIAQMVVVEMLQPNLEKVFHKDSYGFRKGKRAHDALEKARKLCWRYNWVIDLDIKGFFDNLEHELMMKVVKIHTEEKWVQMYIERWLKSRIQKKDGKLVERSKGTPQGGVISPLLANMFLHHAFDIWISREFPTVEFERYADDIIVHCKTLEQAEFILSCISKRIERCKLTLHPKKTKIVYCKDGKRNKKFPHTKFTFLGYTFQNRKTRTKAGKYFFNFSPAVSKDALKKMYSKIRELKLHKKVRSDVFEIAKLLNPIFRGWINYYGKFRKSALALFFHRMNLRLIKWAQWKYKKLRYRKRRSIAWIRNIHSSNPDLFAHWSIGYIPKA